MGTDDGVTPETLADVIRRLRGDANQATFAKRVGLSSGMIGHVESGSRSLGLDALERISSALGLSSVDQLALRNARERTSAELNSRPSTVPLDLMAEFMNQVKALGEEVEHLQRRVAELETASQRKR